MIFAEELGARPARLPRDRPRVVVLGEDIVDPYGGAFKVTRGLSTDFPDRVRTTPISEGAHRRARGRAGAGRLSARSPRSCSATSSRSASTRSSTTSPNTRRCTTAQATCPVVVRAPSGGHRGYGPTHSQSLEKHFLGVPHLKVVAASLFHDPARCSRDFLQQDDPVLYIEHKLLYPQHSAAGPSRRGRRVGAISRDSPGGLPPRSRSRR